MNTLIISCPSVDAPGVENDLEHVKWGWIEDVWSAGEHGETTEFEFGLTSEAPSAPEKELRALLTAAARVIRIE